MKVCLLAGSNPHALAVARHLSFLSIDCFGVGRSPPKPAPLWLVPPGYRYYRGHVGKDNVSVFEALDREAPDTIISFLAQGEGAASFGPEAWRFYQTNCAYLAQLVETLRRRDYLKRFVQVSTSELYGATEGAADESSPVVPTSPYAISKAAFDAHLGVMHRVHGFPALIVRPSNCVTAGMQLHRIVPRAAIAAVYGRRLKLQGGGAAQKSYLDSEDLAKGLLTVIEKGTVGQTYNCGPINPVSIRELVGMVCDRADAMWKNVVDEAPARVGEDSTYWLDSSKLRALGWEPEITIETAVQRMVEWVRAWPQLATMPHEYRVMP